jgi:SOS-response transcriptional repressor LexA
MSYDLTPRQLELLRFIQGYQLATGGVSPSLQDCARGIGSPARSRAHGLLVELERRGAIRRLPRRFRAIDILTPVSIPMDGNRPLYAVPGPWSASSEMGVSR